VKWKMTEKKSTAKKRGKGGEEVGGWKDAGEVRLQVAEWKDVKVAEFELAERKTAEWAEHRPQCADFFLAKWKDAQPQRYCYF